MCDPVAEKYFPDKIISTVEVVTKRGDKYAGHVETADGVPQKPASWEDVKHKFDEMASPVIGKERSKGVSTGVERLEKQSDIRNLTSLLRFSK